MRARILFGLKLLVAAMAVFTVLAIAMDSGATNTRVTIVPNAPAAPTRTAKPDDKSNGYALRSPQPSCTAGEASSYKDANGCIYDCSGGRTVLRTRALGGVCVYPTTGATATGTPTPTATVTVTATA